MMWKNPDKMTPEEKMAALRADPYAGINYGQRRNAWAPFEAAVFWAALVCFVVLPALIAAGKVVGLIP